jgi:phosphomannomutase
MTYHQILSILDSSISPQAILVLRQEFNKFIIHQCTFSDGSIVVLNLSNDESKIRTYTRVIVEESLAKQYIQQNRKFEIVCHCSGHLCSRKNKNAKYKECVTDWSL